MKRKKTIERENYIIMRMNDWKRESLKNVEQKKMRKKVKYEGKDILYETLIERVRIKKKARKKEE